MASVATVRATKPGSASTAGTRPGGGGGAAFRSSSGNVAGAAGADGEAALSFTTAYPYLVQAPVYSGYVGASPSTPATPLFPNGIAAGSLVIVCVSTASGFTPTGVTVGGVNLTELVSASNTGQVSIWYLRNASGGAVGATNAVISHAGSSLGTEPSATRWATPGSSSPPPRPRVPGRPPAPEPSVPRSTKCSSWSTPAEISGIYTGNPASPWQNVSAIERDATAYQAYSTTPSPSPTWTVGTSGGWCSAAVVIGAAATGMFIAMQ